jgi:hypothetical protein
MKEVQRLLEKILKSLGTKKAGYKTSGRMKFRQNILDSYI